MKEKARSGMLWTLIDTLVRRVLAFFVTLVLARLLTPADYGVVAIITVFVQICEVFVQSGFSQALMQKKDRSDDDYRTAFVFNVAVATASYVILFFSAPLIEDYYGIENLCNYARLSFLSIIISSLNIVQNTRLTVALRFDVLTKISIAAGIVSAAVGVTMAYLSFGPWALIVSSLSASAVTCVLLWVVNGFTVKGRVTRESFGALWGYGSKHLASSIINKIYGSLYTLMTGKYYSTSQLGLYDKAKELPNLSGLMLYGVISKVSFAVLVQYQDDKAKLVGFYKKFLNFYYYILFPVLFVLSLYSYDIVRLLWGEEWIDCAYLIKYFAILIVFDYLTLMNLQLLYVTGRTDLVLKLELMKKPIGFLILVLVFTMTSSIKYVVMGQALYSVIAFVFNCYYTGKFINYGFAAQVKDLVREFYKPAVCFGVPYVVAVMLGVSGLWDIVPLAISGLGLVVWSAKSKDESWEYLVEFAKEKVGRRKEHNE